jgi:alkanesulfonate monooxygenase SsuD/methylene tetrahydromethanopterin reductase-like flavin-dependent oxidoreductase (luciferase family)
MFGIPFERPLEYMREYVTILRAALQKGTFDFEGRRFRVHGQLANPPGVPVLLSALRPASFRLAGRIADGALAWVCPLPYLRDQALPALREGAAKAKRAAPPLVAHCFAAVHEDAAAVREAARDRLAGYARTPFYQAMFAQAGYPEAREGKLSEGMIDAVMVHGDDATVAGRLRAYLDAGLDELCVSTLVVGADRRASLERTLRLLATL